MEGKAVKAWAWVTAAKADKVVVATAMVVKA